MELAKVLAIIECKESVLTSGLDRSTFESLYCEAHNLWITGHNAIMVNGQYKVIRHRSKWYRRVR